MMHRSLTTETDPPVTSLPPTARKRPRLPWSDPHDLTSGAPGPRAPAPLRRHPHIRDRRLRPRAPGLQAPAPLRPDQQRARSLGRGVLRGSEPRPHCGGTFQEALVTGLVLRGSQPRPHCGGELDLSPAVHTQGAPGLPVPASLRPRPGGRAAHDHRVLRGSQPRPHCGVIGDLCGVSELGVLRGTQPRPHCGRRPRWVSPLGSGVLRGTQPRPHCGRAGSRCGASVLDGCARAHRGSGGPMGVGVGGHA